MRRCSSPPLCQIAQDHLPRSPSIRFNRGASSALSYNLVNQWVEFYNHVLTLSATEARTHHSSALLYVVNCEVPLLLLSGDVFCLFFFSFVLDVKRVGHTSRGHTEFLIHLPCAVLALIFLARRIKPFLSFVDREVDFCVLTMYCSPYYSYYFFLFFLEYCCFVHRWGTSLCTPPPGSRMHECIGASQGYHGVYRAAQTVLSRSV